MIFRMHSWTPASAGATEGANVNTSIKTALAATPRPLLLQPPKAGEKLRPPQHPEAS